MSSNSFKDHNHKACIQQSMDQVETFCAKNNLRLTPVRRRVLEILLESHRAHGAYDVLERLAEDGAKPAPPVAYRALQFLSEHGFVHRIERLNAYIACNHLHDGHSPAFMICRSCDRVEESHADIAGATLGNAALASGFKIERTVVEAEGLCPDCQNGAA